MIHRCHLSLLVLLSAQVLLRAQPFVQRGIPIGQSRQGLQVQSASASIGYASGAASAFSFDSFGPRDLYYTWASSSITYSRGRDRGSFGITYTPSYAGTFYNGDLQSFNQDLGLQLTRRLTPRVNFFVSASASDVTVEQFLFSSPQLIGSIAGVDQLGRALAAGPSSLPVNQAILYGSRTLNLGGIVGLSYSPSSRLTTTFQGTFSQSQARGRPGLSEVRLLPRTRIEQGIASINSNLTPRSFLSTDVTYSGVQSVIGDYRMTYFTTGYGKRLGRRWIAIAGAGAGRYTALSSHEGRLPEFSAVVSGASYTADASLGFKGRENSFAGLYQRHVGDMYGFGAGSTSSFQGSWSWQRRDRGWSTQITVQQQSIHGGYLGNLSLWQANAGFSRQLSRQTAVNIEYSHILTRLPPASPYNNANIYALRLTLLWRPWIADVTLADPVPGLSDDRLK